MPVLRRFLVAPSLARLVRKERGSARVTEGYFPSQGGRASHVQAEGSQCHLVLVTLANGAIPSEERTEVPRAHADALLDVCPGKVQFERSRLQVQGREVLVDRIMGPQALDLVSVPFETPEEIQAFHAPVWFGPEVTTDTAFANRSIALDGTPQPSPVELSNEALDALLDALENRFGLRQAPAAPTRLQGEDARVMDALRRLASGGAATGTLTPTAEAAATPAPAPAALPDIADAPALTPPAEDADFRMDDVLQGLSQVLESYADAPEAPANTPVVEVDHWRARAQRRQEG